MFFHQSSLHLNISTWEKDSHGLYDYEADRLVKDYFRIEGPCKIFRNWQSKFQSYSRHTYKHNF